MEQGRSDALLFFVVAVVDRTIKEVKVSFVVRVCGGGVGGRFLR